MSMEYAMSTSEEISSAMGTWPLFFIVKPGDMPAYEGAACIYGFLLKDLR